MSRTSDRTVSLAARTNDANQWGADYFVSIHINAGGGSGYEDFIHSSLSNQGATGRYRQIMHEEVMKQVNLQNRGRKQANFHVLRESAMSAILTENGFIDHAADAAKLKSDAFLEQIALGHARGIARIFQLSSKSSSWSSGNSGGSSNNQGGASSCRQNEFNCRLFEIRWNRFQLCQSCQAGWLLWYSKLYGNSCTEYTAIKCHPIWREFW